MAPPACCSGGWRAGRDRPRCSRAFVPPIPSPKRCSCAAIWPPDESLITRTGEWIGRDWLRVSRGADPHAGVIEREHRLKRCAPSSALQRRESAWTPRRISPACAMSLAEAEARTRSRAVRIQAAHREHADLLGQLEAMRARQESSLRSERLEEEAAEVAREAGVTQEALATARTELDQGLVTLGQLDSRKPDLENEREERREALQARRARAQDAQVAAAIC